MKEIRFRSDVIEEAVELIKAREHDSVVVIAHKTGEMAGRCAIDGSPHKLIGSLSFAIRDIYKSLIVEGDMSLEDAQQSAIKLGHVLADLIKERINEN